MDGQTGTIREADSMPPWPCGPERKGEPAQERPENHAGSHALQLVHETLERVDTYLEEEAREELSSIKSPPQGYGLQLARLLNAALHHANVHIGHASEHQRAARREYSAVAKAIAVETLQAVVISPERFDAVHACLSDDASRRVFDWFIAYRTALAFLGKDADALVPGFMTGEAWMGVLRQMSKTLRGGSYHVDGLALRSGLAEVATTFLLEQYRLPGFVEPQESDIVLDCGAYRGETALWFARRVGASGRVIAIEPSPQNAAGLRQNLAANSSAAMGPIVVMEQAVGKRPGTLKFNASAEGSSRVDSRSSSGVRVDTIDDLVAQLGLPHVDFIKMDIEGGEVDALDGAVTTPRTFAPRLALSVYHRPADLPDITERIRSAVPGYRLSLSQKSPGLDETILFAKAEKGAAR